MIDYYNQLMAYRMANISSINTSSLDAANRNADKFCNNVEKLGEDIGLTRSQLMQIALFIETQLPKQIQHGNYYLKKEITGIPRTIEYDPETKSIFIHLKEHNIPMIGKGGFKTVTNSIQYHSDNPEIIANCTTTVDEIKEVECFKALRNLPGIAQAYAFTKHRRFNGEYRLSILMKRYSLGSLDKIISDKTYHFSLQEKMKIALDALKGLESLQSKGILHRDLKPGNLLIDLQIDKETKKTTVAAAITDFGLARQLQKNTPLTLAHGTPIFTPPSACITAKIDKKKIKQLDSYPLGCALYTLFYEKDPKWLEEKSLTKVQEKVKRVIKSKKDLKNDKKAKSVTKILNAHVSIKTTPRIKKLEKKKKLSQQDKFELLILKMIKPKNDREVGKETKEIRRKLERIM